MAFLGLSLVRTRDLASDRLALAKSRVKPQRERALMEPIVQDTNILQGFGDSANAQQLLASLKGAASTANRAIRDRVKSLPMGVFLRRFQEGQFVDTPAFDHPLQRLLEDPTADESGVSTHSYEQLFGLVVTHYNTVGEAYLFVLRDGLGVPMSLQIARPGTVQQVVQAGRLVGYRVQSQASEIMIGPNDAVHIWDPDPDMLHSSKGLMPTQATDVLLEQQASQHWQKHYENDAIPKVVFEATEATINLPDSTQREAIAVSWFRRLHRRVGQQQGLPAYVLPGWHTKELSSQSEAQSGVTLLTHARRSVFQDFRVPPSQVGDVVDVNRASAETSNFVFDLKTIEPYTILIAQALTHQLAPQYGTTSDDVRLIVKYLPFVAADKEFELQRETADLTGKVRSPNEVRAGRQPELPAASWGDFPVSTGLEGPYTGEIIEEPDLSAFGLDEITVVEEEEAEEERQQPTSSRARISYLRAYFQPEHEWQRQLARDAMWTPRFQSQQSSLFRRQMEITLERYAKLVKRSGRSDHNGSDREHQSDWFTRGAAEDLAEELFPTKGWDTLFKVTTDRVRGAAFVDSADDVMRTILGKPFRMTEFAADVLLQQNQFHHALVNQTTRGHLSQVLADAVSSGASTEETAREIAQVFGRRLKDARRIARTEIAGAVSAAQVEGYRQTGVVEKKQWNSSLDATVRDSHTIDGQVVDLDDRFTLGSGADALGPGDPTLSAADRANCRCFTTPVFIDEVLIPGLGTAGSGVSGF